MKPDLLNRLPPRVRKWLLLCGGAFVLYVLIGFFLVPPIIKWQMVKQLPAITKREAAVRQVKVNPLVLSLTVRGLSLTEPDGRPFVSWDELYVNFQASSLFRQAWTFKEIRLVKPFSELIVFKDGRLNFSNMSESTTNATPQPQATSIPRINISHLEITNGFFVLEDRTRRSVFRTEYRPISLKLKEFTTRADADTPYSFHAESDAGRSVAWEGDLAIQPLRSSGHLEITGVNLRRYQPYLEEFTSAQLTNGLADLQFDYRFSAGTNGVDLVVTNGTVQVAQLQIVDPTTGEIVSGLGGLTVSQAEFNLRGRTVRFGAFMASEASLLARLNKDGKLNLLNLITSPSAPTNATPKVDAPGEVSPTWTVAVDDFTIEKTAVSFEDLTRHSPFKTELKPIEVSLKNFTTKADAEASYSFRIASEASESLEGNGSVSINPIRSSGEVIFGAVDVKKYLPYAEDFFRGKIMSGKVETRIPYRFALGTNSLLAGVTNLSVKLTDLEVQMPDNPETITHIAEIGFERVDANLEERRGRVGLFKGNGGSFLVRRQKDGAINLLGLLAASRTNAALTPDSDLNQKTPHGDKGTNTAAYALGGWTLNLDELRLENYTVTVEDLIPAKPAKFQLDQLTLNLKGVSTASNTPVSANVSFRLNETGTVAAQGTARIAPLSADVDVALTNLDVRAVQPYLDPFVALNLSSGALTTTCKIRFQTNDTAAPLLTLAGSVRLTNFVTIDQVGLKEFVRFDELAVTGIDVAFVPARVKIDEILLVKPKVSLLVGADRQLNLSSISKKDSGATNAASATDPAPGPVKNSPAEVIPIELGTVQLDRAAFAFADETVRPHVAVGVEEMSGTIQRVSSTSGSPANVDLHGLMDVQSPFSVTGRLNPFADAMLLDLAFTNANTQLTALTGYMEKYGGYPLQKGRLSTSLHYRVEGKALQAENKIQVDQLTFGAHNNSPDATSLPVKLGVALLKDNNGRIELDVPVAGKLDDPQFKPGSVILKVIGNILLKAAASPFNLLGALVGGGGDELGFVEFTPGTAEMMEGESSKLGKLAAALNKRPSLNLGIEGVVNPASDREALAKFKLREQLKTRRLQELTAEGKASGSAETFQVEPADMDRLLRATFVEQFGTNISEVIEINRARLTVINQTAAVSPPEPKRSLFRRVTGLIGTGTRTQSKAEKRLSKADQQALSLATPDLMEALLAEKIKITDEDFRQLITVRARRVQDWLLQNGQVDADRLLLVSPKPIDANYRGQNRANLSLN